MSNYGFDVLPGDEIPKEIYHRPGRKPIYPYLETEVGEGFFIPGRTKIQMSSCKRYWKSASGRVFETFNGTRNGVEGCFAKRIK